MNSKDSNLLPPTLLTTGDGRTLLISVPEIAHLIVYGWIHTKRDSDCFNAFFKIIGNGLNILEMQAPWVKALGSFMADPVDAEVIIRKCTRCLRVPGVLGSLLYGLLVLIDCAVENCPPANFALLYDSKKALLVNISRACERQLCQCTDESDVCNSMVMKRGIEILQ